MKSNRYDDKKDDRDSFWKDIYGNKIFELIFNFMCWFNINYSVMVVVRIGRYYMIVYNKS